MPAIEMPYNICKQVYPKGIGYQVDIFRWKMMNSLSLDEKQWSVKEIHEYVLQQWRWTFV